jgi:hypothetical protein
MKTQQPIYVIARDEADRWGRSGKLPRGLVIAVLWSFCFRLTTGKTYEEAFCKEKNGLDYQI